jgi:hypothetical protein
MAKDNAKDARKARPLQLSAAAVVFWLYRAALARGASQRTAVEHAELPRSMLQDLDWVRPDAELALDVCMAHSKSPKSMPDAHLLRASLGSDE